MRFIFSFLFLFFSLNIFANDIIDIDKKIEEAKKEEKTLMFFFHIPNCPYCKGMLDENFKNEKTLKLIEENFIFVDIYTADKKSIVLKDFKGSPKEFAKYIGASAYPATLFMDTNAKIFYKAIGYRNIQEYIYEITYITTKNYKKMKLDEFILKVEMEDE